MKLTTSSVLAGLLLVASVWPTDAAAQTADSRPAAPAAAHKVGLVDVGHIFDNYQKLQDRRDALQKEIEASAADPELGQIQEEVKALQAQAAKVSKGSDKASELEQKMIELNAKGQARLAALKREFMRKEVTLYKEIYGEVTNMVTQYASAKKYTLVIRYQRDPVEPGEETDDPREMMNRVNQLVVFHQPEDDMTDAILKYMNSQYAPAAATSGAGQAPTTRTATGTVPTTR